MRTSVHFPTMHRHMAVSLLHDPPVLLLRETKRKGKQMSGRMQQGPRENGRSRD